MQRRKTASLAAAGFLVAAAAFASGQQPAGASEDEQQVTISYVSYGSEDLRPAPCTPTRRMTRMIRTTRRFGSAGS